MEWSHDVRLTSANPLTLCRLGRMLLVSLASLFGSHLVAAATVVAISNSPPSESIPPTVCPASLCRLCRRAHLRFPYARGQTQPASTEMENVTQCPGATLSQWEVRVRGYTLQPLVSWLATLGKQGVCFSGVLKKGICFSHKKIIQNLSLR